MNLEPPLLELLVTSRMDNLGIICDFCESIANQFGLSEDDAFAVQLAVDEACTNIIEHAYEERPDGTIRITCKQVGDQVVIRIQDSGKSFDRKQVAPPDLTAPLEERRENGLGLYLMEKVMDDVEFEHDPVRGNQVTLRKKMSREMQTG